MQRSDALEERIADLFRERVTGHQRHEAPFVQILKGPGHAVVREREQEGEAEVPMAIPEGCTCIQFQLTPGLFQFLRDDKNADGPFFLCRADGRVEAHIVECKKTVGKGAWRGTLAQFHCTLHKLLALAGALGITIDAVVFYTAFRFDLLTEPISPNPTPVKRTLGPPDDAAHQDLIRRRAWESDEIPLRGYTRAFRHHKIPLDPTTGTAASAFTSPPAHL